MQHRGDHRGQAARVGALGNEVVDLFDSTDANAPVPVWTLIATLAPDREGAQTLATMLVLAPGTVQAIRASLRGATAAADACGAGPTDDRDDIAFRLAP